MVRIPSTEANRSPRKKTLLKSTADDLVDSMKNASETDDAGGNFQAGDIAAAEAEDCEDAEDTAATAEIEAEDSDDTAAQDPASTCHWLLSNAGMDAADVGDRRASMTAQLERRENMKWHHQSQEV
jgi:hypothetical protein